MVGDSATGKSTFVKFLLNSLLSKTSHNARHPKNSPGKGICLLDVDPGQPEKSLPGVLTVGPVSLPTLGSAFTYSLAIALNLNKDVASRHQDLSPYVRTTAQQFYGLISPTREAEYVSAISNLVDVFNLKHANQPLVINTMGYTSGQGVHFIIDLFKIAKPTHVIHLTRKPNDNQFSRANLRVAMKKNDYNGTYYSHEYLGNDLNTYKYLQIESRRSCQRTSKPAFLRELRFLSNLSALCHLKCNASLPNRAPVVTLSTRNVRFYDFKRRQNSRNPDLIGGDWIVLCSNFKSSDFTAQKDVGKVKHSDSKDWRKGRSDLDTNRNKISGSTNTNSQDWRFSECNNSVSQDWRRGSNRFDLETMRRELNAELAIPSFIGMGVVQDWDRSAIHVLIPEACLAGKVVETIVFNVDCGGDDSAFAYSKLF